MEGVSKKVPNPWADLDAVLQGWRQCGCSGWTGGCRCCFKERKIFVEKRFISNFYKSRLYLVTMRQEKQSRRPDFLLDVSTGNLRELVFFSLKFGGNEAPSGKAFSCFTCDNLSFSWILSKDRVFYIPRTIPVSLATFSMEKKWKGKQRQKRMKLIFPELMFPAAQGTRWMWFLSLCNTIQISVMWHGTTCTFLGPKNEWFCFCKKTNTEKSFWMRQEDSQTGSGQRCGREIECFQLTNAAKVSCLIACQNSLTEHFGRVYQATFPLRVKQLTFFGRFLVFVSPSRGLHPATALILSCFALRSVRRQNDKFDIDLIFASVS